MMLVSIVDLVCHKRVSYLQFWPSWQNQVFGDYGKYASSSKCSQEEDSIDSQSIRTWTIFRGKTIDESFGK